MLGTGAGIAIITVGGFAALSQLQIAQPIVNGLFYAILAVVAGSLIIAVGGAASSRCSSGGSRHWTGTTRRSR